MTEKGRVISVHERRALIELLPGEQCAHCSLCSQGSAGRKMSLELEAIEGLHPGHEVTIQIDSREVLKGGWTIFILPLMSFIVGAVAAPDIVRALGARVPSELASIAIGGFLLCLTFLGIYLRARNPKYQKKLTPRIVDFQ